MSLISWDDLNEGARDIVESVRMFTENDDRFGLLELSERFNKDEYAQMLVQVIGDINVAQPYTSYTVNGFPRFWDPIATLGLRVWFYRNMADAYVEYPPLTQVHSSYAQLDTLMDRWKVRGDELQLMYENQKKIMKIQYHLPGPRVTVDMYGYVGLPPGRWMQHPQRWHP